MYTPSDFRVLVVDDVDDNLFLLRTVLETEGYDVDTANSGTLALAKVNEYPPDLILMDVMMPDMNGYEVTREIRENPQLPWMPILMVTASDSTAINCGLPQGASGLIRKPVQFDHLLNQVSTLLKIGHRKN